MATIHDQSPRDVRIYRKYLASCPLSPALLEILFHAGSPGGYNPGNH